VVTSSQFNRDGYGNSDVDLTNTSESMGITHTADAIFGIITTEALDELGQIMIKQLKNRWGDINYYRRFLVGIDRSKMKIYELEESAQKNIFPEGGNSNKKSSGNSDTFDKTDIGNRLSSRKSKVFGDIELT
jgi:endo-1,4-beta-mannosidase